MGRSGFDGPEQTDGPDCVAELARLFPGAVPVRIPVRVRKGECGKAALVEQTVIEFGTAEEIFFVSGLPLDFDDIVWVSTPDGSLDVQAKIVAMRFDHRKMAIAARFLEEVSNWIIKA